MRLKTRILLLAPVAMVGMLLVAAVFYAGNIVDGDHRAELEKSYEIHELRSQINSSFLQARRAEKDFLLRRDEKYVQRHKAIAMQIGEQINRLALLLGEDFPGEMNDQISLLENGFPRYVSKFAELVEKNRALGLDEKSGLQGSLRKAVHEAETSLKALAQPELTVKMLMMRRHEKDFIMRVKNKYVDRLDARIAEFKAFPLGMFGSPSTRTEVFSRIDTYQADFHKFAATTLEERALRKDLSAVFAQIEPAFEEITTFVTDLRNRSILSLQASKKTTFSAVMVVTGLAILIVGFLALLIARSVSGPLAATASALKALAAGDADIDVAGIGRRDEIGEIANAFEDYRVLTLEKAAAEQEAARAREASERTRDEELAAAEAQQKQDLQTAVTFLGEGLDRLSAGDVSYRIETPFVSTLDALRVSFNNSVSTLEDALRSVDSNSKAVRSASEEIRSAADDLSRRTEQQAASVEETAAALEQIMAAVKASAERAREAGELVVRARNGAEQSGDIVNRATRAMGDIEASSQEIGNIVGVIDEIAFQINLLALNAGVEAARAGEAGKGFAVVAQEVRELAGRSAKAASDIKSLISGSGEHVKSGVSLVGETGKALAAIVSEVREIDTHMRAIVDAAGEQATSLDEVNSAIETVDQGTQQNASIVEESTSASHSLTQKATDLDELVSRFRFSSDGAGRGPKEGKKAA